MRKKLIAALVVTSLALTACASSAPTATPAPAAPATPATPATPAAPATPAEPPKSDLKLNIGATALPHAEILNFIKEDMAKEGVELTVTEFGDYTLLNPSLNDKQIDANFFQHQPYLDDYVANSGQKLVPVVKVHTEPIGIYSSKIKSLADLQDGAKVAIPNDATNEARALLLLESKGLLKLKEGVGFNAMPDDITENPKNLNIVELDAALLPRALDESDISIINTNYALEANLNPTTDALEMEAKDSPYANIIVVNEADKDNEAIQKLINVITNDKVRTFINETYKGAVVPSF